MFEKPCPVTALSLRGYIATQLGAGLLAYGGSYGYGAEDNMARVAIRHADALIKALEEQPSVIPT